MLILDYFAFGTNDVAFYQDEREEDEEETDGQVVRAQIFCCRTCSAHISRGQDIFSTNFHGTSGKAYLFNNAINVIQSAPEERRLRTGRHTVCDIFCVQCNRALGWKYLAAADAEQRYKVDKYIVELAQVRRRNDGRNAPNEQAWIQRITALRRGDGRSSSSSSVSSLGGEEE